MIITITKRSAARAEIEGAIAALARDENYIAAELLASAAIDVIRGVTKNASVETMSDRLLSGIKPERRAEFAKLLRKPYNFMKHSDRDKDTAIDRYNVDAAVWRIFVAILDYESCWIAKSPMMLFYLAWFTSRYPDLVQDELKRMTEMFS